MSTADKAIECVQCREMFIFTEGEQMYYAEKGFTNDPKRCKACRELKKQSRKSQGG